MLNILENVSLAPLTTLKVGGAARFFVEAGTESDVAAAVEHAAAGGVELFILGGGSNILVSDKGFDGLVVRIVLKGIEPARGVDSEREVITASAGEDWDGFVEYCVGRDLAGVECLSGIPGTVGGTPVQNVGAYGQEVSETIVSVRCLDRQSGRIVELSDHDCGFGYRTSIFNSSQRERYIVLSVTFALERSGEAKIVYRDLHEHFAGARPTLAATRSAVLKIRAAKSMVIDPNDPNCSSAGSFFKNPVVQSSEIARIASAAGADAVPHFDAGGKMVKIPAAWLIEQAGFKKGFVMGNAGISTRHSLALINRGNASAAEIIQLKNKIIDAVRTKFDIELLPEPIFIGF